MATDDDMPCGDCGACGEPVDHDKTGICGKCGQAFHWDRCGGWVNGEHECKGCDPYADEDDGNGE